MIYRNGPSDFLPLGSLKDFNLVEQAHRIQVPTLLLNGRYDQAQDEVMEPWFREVPHVKWVQFAESSHMWLWEERKRSIQVLACFLTTV